MYTLDTNTIIYYLQGDHLVTSKFNQWLQNDEALIISTIVEAELFSSSKLTRTDEILIGAAIATLMIIPVDSKLARRAAQIRRKYKNPLVDAIITATALEYKAPLVTRNIKDFTKVKELSVQKI